jgi:LysR family glycine cleavage system transcriptional activator
LLRSSDEPWKPWFEAAGLDWPEVSRGPIFSDSAHMVQAAAEGQGIALARRSLLGTDIQNGVLVRLFDVAMPSAKKFYLVYPARTAGSAKLALFRAWLEQEVAADEALARRESKPRARAGTKRRTLR